ncbi:hypothetical protein [Paenibacillus sp. S-12]|uniref:hypothetical protein n=1 Tax=Paenibacillus sp. S-12 TaxID=3031371 RepID=UPI0025A0DFF8|nr:hypothetical protein [Paenibacillus sp. S-12]
MAKKPRTVYVKHSSFVEGGKRYERVDVFKPNNVITPFHTFDRDSPESYLNDFDAAIESLMWIGNYASANLQKWKADDLKLSSSVEGAAELITGLLEISK